MSESILLQHYARHLTDSSGRSPAIRLRLGGIVPLVGVAPEALWNGMREGEGEGYRLHPLTAAKVKELGNQGVPLRLKRGTSRTGQVLPGAEGGAGASPRGGAADGGAEAGGGTEAGGGARGKEARVQAAGLRGDGGESSTGGLLDDDESGSPGSVYLRRGSLGGAISSVAGPAPLASVVSVRLPDGGGENSERGERAGGEKALADEEGEVEAYLADIEPEPDSYVLDLELLPPVERLDSAAVAAPSVVVATPPLSKASGIQTALGELDYAPFLRRLAAKDQELRDEKSIQGLTLGLWMLHYRDSADSPWVQAPLALMPVTLDESRVRGQARFDLKAVGSLNLNAALWARIRTHYGVEWPAFPADPNQPGAVNTWLAEVAAAVSAMGPEWRLLEGAALAIITTQKQALRRDLLASDTAGLAASLPVLRAMANPDQVTWTPAPTEALDQTFAPDQVPLVVGADGSQLEAVRHALETDASVVIQGPPGTGKSQTITLLLAGARSRGNPATDS